MALFPLGILSAAVAGEVGVPAYELIESTILTTTPNSITFSNLGDFSSTYKHLQIRYVARDTNTGTNVRNITAQFNSDSTSYYSHYLGGDGSTVVSGAISTSSQFYPGIYYSGGTTEIFGAGIIDILDAYSTTKNTTTRSLHGIGASGGGVYLSSGLYIDTQAVGSVTLFENGTSFAVGSRFSIYGIKG